MDHEFDRTASNSEHTSEDSGEKDVPAEQPSLEQPPNGPSAAHFREAARLAAARARKAIANEQSPDGAIESPDAAKDDTALDEKTFAKAARKRAMHVSGRDSKTKAVSPEKEKTPPAPGSPGVIKKNTKEAVSQIDERLMLGARMLRAFESQIERLNSAAERAEGISRPTPIVEPQTNQKSDAEDFKEHEALVQRAEDALAALERQTNKAMESADSLANSIEIAGAITSTQEQWTEQMSTTEASMEARITSVLTRTEHALESMEEQFRRVTEIERAVMTRIDQAMVRLEANIKSPHAPDPSNEKPTAKKKTPLIEVESFERPKETTQRIPTRNDPPAEVPAPGDSEDESLSVGTLSIDPSLLARRRERDQ
jgi:hypothetical protein